MPHPASAKTVERTSQQQAERRAHEQRQGSGPSGSYADILALQRTVGNRAVGQLVQPGAGASESCGNALPSIVQSVLSSGGGRPLDPATRALMEGRSCQDFSQIRVHTDAQTASSAQAVNAKAYTAGQSVVFGTGGYAPDASAGGQLSAHELARVVQQSRGGVLRPSPRSNSPLEQSAARATSSLLETAGPVQTLDTEAAALSNPPTPVQPLNQETEGQQQIEGEAPVLHSLVRTAGAWPNGVFAVQRAAGNRTSGNLFQRDTNAFSDDVPRAIDTVLRAGGGQALDPSTRALVEARFGADFDMVRIYTGTEAAASASALGAAAYSVGEELVFGAGQYAPNTDHGRWVLAHELAHVLQQRAADIIVPGVGPAGGPHEQAAYDAAGRAIVSPAGQHGPGAVASAALGMGGLPVVPAVQRLDVKEEDQARLDEFRATLIEISSGAEWQDVTILLNEVNELNKDFQTPKGPRTQIATARALLKIYHTLEQHAAAAPREHDGTLLTSAIGGELVPWTPQRPHSLADIPLLSPKNVAAWNEVAFGKQTPLEARPARHGRARRQATVLAAGPSGKMPKHATKPAEAGIGVISTSPAAGGAPVGSAREFQIDVLKTPDMSLQTPAGKVAFYAAVIHRLIPKATEEQADTAAAELVRATTVQPEGRQTVSEMESSFEDAEAGTPFIFNVYPSFLWQLNERLAVPKELLNPEEFAETGTREAPKRPADLRQPLLERYNLAERIAWAQSKIAEARKRRPDTPHRYEAGQFYGNNMFIYHPNVDSPDQQVWMTPDGRLFQTNEKQVNVEAIFQGVGSAAPMVIVAWIVVGASTLLVGGYLVAAAAPEVAAAVVPRISAAASKVAAAASAVKTSTLYWVLSNPYRALFTTEFVVGTVIKVKEAGGLKDFFSKMASVEGVIQTGYDILTLMVMMRSTRGEAPRQMSVPTRVQQIQGNDITLVVVKDPAPAGAAIPAPRVTTPPHAEEPVAPPSPAVPAARVTTPLAEEPVAPPSPAVPAPREVAPPPGTGKVIPFTPGQEGPKSPLKPKPGVEGEVIDLRVRRQKRMPPPIPSGPPEPESGSQALPVPEEQVEAEPARIAVGAGAGPGRQAAPPVPGPEPTVASGGTKRGAGPPIEESGAPPQSSPGGKTATKRTSRGQGPSGTRGEPTLMRQKAEKYLEYLMTKFPKLREAGLRVVSRGSGIGKFEERVKTGGGRYSIGAKLRDGRGIEIDDITSEGIVVDNKERESLRIIRHRRQEQIEQERSERGLDFGERPRGRSRDIDREMEVLWEKERDKATEQLLKQSKFIEENEFKGGLWMTSDLEYYVMVKKLLRELGITNIKIEYHM